MLDDAEKERVLAEGLGGKGKIDVQRFKGLGEKDAKDLKDTTMNPETRKLIRSRSTRTSRVRPETSWSG